jgi:hypothetical protein
LAYQERELKLNPDIIMQFLISHQQNKPNRVETSEELKDENYHIQYARWVIGTGLNQQHQDYLSRYNLNKNFYMNNQWCLEEDTELFFKDENNNDRNRLKVTQNYIQPMVEQYRGNAIRMSFDMKVANLSPLAKSRRERSLSRLLMYNYVAKKMPGFGDYMQENNMPMGADNAEVESKFNNLQSDLHVIAINRLLRYVKNINSLDEKKPDLALDVALAGIGIMEPYPYAGEWLFERVLPSEFGWDRSAKSPTLADSDFFFKYADTSVTTLFERYQDMSIDQRRQVEEFASNILGRSRATGNMVEALGKIPVYKAIWRDLTVDTFGYVTDKFGQRVLGRLGYIEENETEPRYTFKDVVPFKDLTEFQKRVMKGGSTTRLYVDLWRYCEFIPAEILPSSSMGKHSDVALEYGILPYQEPDLYRPTNMQVPFKVGTWSYVDGVCLSPVDVVINPQRMINRFLSVMENQINNSGGAGVVFDKDLLGGTPEDEFRAKVMKGEAIGVYAKGRGVQNIVGRYDSTPKESVVAFSTLIEAFKQGIEQVTGVNEGIKGDTGNPDQLVGVMQLMIQRGSIIQEPFYQALTDIFKGCYQNIATSAKRYYIDHDAELIDAIGEDGAEILKLSKDMRWETMRVSLIRTMDVMNERVTVDSTLMAWVQFGLMDQPTIAKLIGKATMEEAILELKEFHKRLENQKRMAAQQQQQMAMQQQNVQEQAGEVLFKESVRDKTREQFNKDADRGVKMANIQAK